MLGRLALALPLLVAPGLLVAASAPVAAANPLAAQLARATAEARAAEAEVERLEKEASAARGEAERLHARQAAAAEAIAATEARISAADARLRLLGAEIASRRARLAKQREPAGALLAGLAMMASRPPLLAILDESSTDEFVRVRLLLDSTLPEIRRRTTALADEVEQGRRLQRQAEAARIAVVRERGELAERRERFAALEDQVLRLAEQRGAEALGVGDVALARGEMASRLSEQQDQERSARRFAAEFAQLAPAPARPVPPASRDADPPIAYVLPSGARVTEGFGSVSPAGIRSRGLTLATRRGDRLLVPAAGIVRFSGPFRGHDGIVIIDHGQGWMSLILDASSPLTVGTRVEAGEPLGRALGPIGVELSRNGQHLSPALIAGSSQKLSNGTKRG